MFAASQVDLHLTSSTCHPLAAEKTIKVGLPLSNKVIAEVVNEKGNPAPSHLAAFRMKVKIHVFHFFHAEVSNQFFKGQLDRSLMSCLVDEVDEYIPTICGNLFLKMLPCWLNLVRSATWSKCPYRLVNLMQDLQFWLVLQIIDLCPVHRNTSPRLHITHPELLRCLHQN